MASSALRTAPSRSPSAASAKARHRAPAASIQGRLGDPAGCGERLDGVGKVTPGHDLGVVVGIEGLQQTPQGHQRVGVEPARDLDEGQAHQRGADQVAQPGRLGRLDGAFGGLAGLVWKAPVGRRVGHRGAGGDHRQLPSDQASPFDGLGGGTRRIVVVAQADVDHGELLGSPQRIEFVAALLAVQRHLDQI